MSTWGLGLHALCDLPSSRQPEFVARAHAIKPRLSPGRFSSSAPRPFRSRERVAHRACSSQKLAACAAKKGGAASPKELRKNSAGGSGKEESNRPHGKNSDDPCQSPPPPKPLEKSFTAVRHCSNKRPCLQSSDPQPMRLVPGPLPRHRFGLSAPQQKGARGCKFSESHVRPGFWIYLRT